MAQGSRHEREVDKFARLVQALAVLSVLIMAIVDVRDNNSEIPAWIYGGMFGVAVGAKPNDIFRLKK